MNIRDAIYKDINVSDVEASIIDDPNFQRLRYIKHGGFRFLIYPTDNGTRFDHSVGTMHATKDICRTIFGNYDEEIAVAGLLHDVGHTPFSHQGEDIAKKYLKKTHEDLGYDIIRKSSIADKISDSGLDLKKVLDFFEGKGYGKLIVGSMGSDRIDYLLRDSYYTGVALGIIDYNRLKHTLGYVNDKPVLFINGITNAESFFIARYFMYESVYFHHTSLISELMFIKSVENAIDDGYINAEEFAKMDDYEAIYHLRNYKGKNLVNRILDRRLFKRSFYKDVNGMNFGDKELNELNEMIESKIGKDDYVSKLIKFKGGNDDLTIVNGEEEELGKLSEYSSIFSNLIDVMKSREILLVASDPINKEKINGIVEKYIDSFN